MSSDGSNGGAPKADVSVTSSQRRRSRKRNRDSNAPVQPANAFTRFMMVRRPQLVREHPEMSHIDISKRIGAEWKALSTEERTIYVEKAAFERDQYLKQLSEYKKTEAYRLFRKKKRQEEECRSRDQSLDDDKYDIPIFSKEFLDMNREREAELRRLRVEVVRLEDEQTALDSNISRLKTVTEQLDIEMLQQREATEKLNSQLDAYRRALVQAFAHMPFPGSNVVPTICSIDTYMSDIHKLVLETPGENQDFVAKVRDIVTKLKMPTTV